MFLAYFQEIVSREIFEWEDNGIDKVDEPEHNEQSSTASEMVPEAATTIMAPMSTKCYSHGDQSTY